MSRRTPHDEAFKRQVAAAFKLALDDARKQKYSVEEFGKKLGITRAGVYKILSGKTIPSLRVLQKARRFWGVRLSYGDLGDKYVRAKRADPQQIRIEFFSGAVSKDQIEVKKFSPSGENSLELVIRIDFSKIA
jgi:transcriptional regulator with XRE-family HTH domain